MKKKKSKKKKDEETSKLDWYKSNSFTKRKKRGSLFQYNP